MSSASGSHTAKLLICLASLTAATACSPASVDAELLGQSGDEVRATPSCTVEPAQVLVGDPYQVSAVNLAKLKSVRVRIVDAAGTRDTLTTTDATGSVVVESRSEAAGVALAQIYVLSGAARLQAECDFEVVAPVVCGDRACDAAEDCSSCPIDCGACAAAGAFRFDAASYAIGESDGQVAITIEREGGTAGAVEVQWRTTAIDATFDVDYASFGWVALRFADGERAKTLPIAVLADSLVEGDESFRVRLDYPAGGATLGSPSEAVVTILDDDSVVTDRCGDHVCADDEGCAICAADCGPCAPVCGDGTCDAGESCQECPADCHVGCTPVAAKAFPGAEGAGSDTPGGRGGAICRVTNLDDAGAGSLRDCLEVRSGPRTVIFDTGGAVRLLSMIRMSGENDSFVTVAGQTAPGGGIELQNYGILVSGAHDIILRHLRIRPGTANPSGVNPSNVDALQLYGATYATRAHHIVIDHCSLEWTLDENASNWDYVTDVTWQWNIIAEPGSHPMGFLHGAGSDLGTTMSISAHHNLLAHNAERNPRAHKASSFVDWVNNVVYNWGTWGRASFTEGAFANFVNNHYLKGPDSPAANTFLTTDNTAAIYMRGNWGPACASGCAGGSDAALTANPGDLVATPFATAPVTVTPTAELLPLVVSGAGAIHCSIDRECLDVVDARIISETLTGTGTLGMGPPTTYANPTRGTPWVDRDNDGMPDAWETSQGLNPGSATDGGNADADGDGYTNLEEWLNGTSARAAER